VITAGWRAKLKKWMDLRALSLCGACLLLASGQLYFSRLATQAESGLNTLYTIRGSWNYAFVDAVKDLILFSSTGEKEYYQRMQLNIGGMNAQQNNWGRLLNNEDDGKSELMFERYGRVSSEQRLNLEISLQRASHIPIGPKVDPRGYRLDADLQQLARLGEQVAQTPPGREQQRYALRIYELTNAYTRRNIGDMMRTGAAVQMQIGLYDRLHNICGMGLLILAAAGLTMLGRRLLSKEQDLIGSQQELALIAQATNDALWEYDAVQKKVWINDQFADFFGIKDRDNLPKSMIWELAHPDDRQAARQDYKDTVLRREPLWLRDVRIRRVDGSYAIMAVRARLIYDANGRHLRAMGGMRDITQRRNVEIRQQLLFEHNVTGIIRADIEGKVTECNTALCQLLGYESWEELSAAPLHNIYVHPEQKMQIVEDMRAGREVKHRELQVYCRDGSIKTILSTPIIVPDAQSGRQNIECIIQDVTELQQLRQELVQSQKMEAIGRLAGGVAHDFNNLLMVMGSYAQMMTRTHDEEKRQRYAEQMLEATRRGAALTGQLLSFSRRQVMQTVTLDVNDSLRHIAELLPRVLGENVALELKLRPGLLPTRIDPSYLDQVIMNLAVNARDAMPGGGRLVIETDIAPAETEPSLVIIVTDNGEGMEPAILERIFEPFYTSKPAGKGTGLGLSTVYGIVRQNGGRIAVESTPGKGACFRIYLPLRNEPVVSTCAAPTSKDSVLPPISVLLAEDEQDVREAVAEHLRAHGCRVACAGNADEALTLCAESSVNFDLLLTDVIMPGLNGRELADRARQLNPKLRVLFMSGYTDDVFQREQLGENFLQKPFRLETLSQRIVQIFNISGE